MSILYKAQRVVVSSIPHDLNLLNLFRIQFIISPIHLNESKLHKNGVRKGNARAQSRAEETGTPGKILDRFKLKW